jgi:subtilisin family serine protease
MKKSLLIALCLFVAPLFCPSRAAADTRVTVQTTLGPVAMDVTCLLRGCRVVESAYGSPYNYFVVSAPNSANANFLINLLQSVPGILKVTIEDVVGPNGLLFGNRLIVRTNDANGLKRQCSLLKCQVLAPIDGLVNSLFVVVLPNLLDPQLVLAIVRALPGVVDAELDQVVNVVTGGATATQAPPSLVNTTPVQYYGSTVWAGYLNQPATSMINLPRTQQQFNLTGRGVIADIDTGVDPNHPVLKPVLLQGFDFTRNQAGGNEMNDLPAGAPVTETPCVNCTPGTVNQRSIAMVDQRSIAMVDGPKYQAFGHGTMVAGILHLVAPKASLLPLKAFKADGTGQLSDIISAVYFAVQNKANVVNMSFDLTSSSNELAKAITSAEAKGVVFVASSGNDGKIEMVYPAGYANVMGVASINDENQRSTFSNYGNQIVWISAPGEAIVTTYPFGGYAAGWGTSFSSPLVAGTVDLLNSESTTLNQNTAKLALSHADPLLAIGMGVGRLDVYQATASLHAH